MHQIPKSEVITILGNGKVGKTSIIRQFLQHNFVDKYTPTVEDTFSKVIDVNGQPITVQFIDSSGAYSFPAMRRLWIQKATAFILVFSVNDRDSFDFLGSILAEIREERKRNDFQSSTPIVVAANKSDLDTKTVDDELVEDWVLNNDIPFDSLIYCSAKTNDSITNLFQSLWEQRRDQVKSSQIIEDLQNTCQKINAPNNGLSSINPSIKSKRRFSAFAVLTGSSLNGSLNQRRDSSTAADVIVNLNNNFGSPSIVRGRRGSRNSITKLLIGGQKLGLKNQGNNPGAMSEKLRFDCLIS